MYPPEIVQPMKDELIDLGFEDASTADKVDELLSMDKGVVLVVINSVCGCAAGGARPGIKLALNHSKTPDRLVTVFAGYDVEATQRAREYLLPYPPSSPSIGVFKDGKLVYMLARSDIEGRSPEMIANNLKDVFDELC